MSSVTFRKALGSYQNLQDLAQKEEDAEDKRMAENDRRLSDDKDKANASTTAAVAAAALGPIIPPRQGLVGLALMAVCTVLAQLFASPFQRSRMFAVVICTVGMFVADFVVTHPRCGKARWYVLHAVANLFITLFSVPDLIATLRSPTRCFMGEYSLVPVYLIAAVHLYHMLAFRCNTGDYVHHLVFGGIICPMGMFFVTGPVQNAVAFFICGLPGGLDYFMLALVKLGRMCVARPPRPLCTYACLFESALAVRMYVVAPRPLAFAHGLTITSSILLALVPFIGTDSLRRSGTAASTFGCARPGCWSPHSAS